jgi:hypothetical protein
MLESHPCIVNRNGGYFAAGFGGLDGFGLVLEQNVVVRRMVVHGIAPVPKANAIRASVGFTLALNIVAHHSVLIPDLSSRVAVLDVVGGLVRDYVLLVDDPIVLRHFIVNVLRIVPVSHSWLPEGVELYGCTGALLPEADCRQVGHSSSQAVAREEHLIGGVSTDGLIDGRFEPLLAQLCVRVVKPAMHSALLTILPVFIFYRADIGISDEVGGVVRAAEGNHHCLVLVVHSNDGQDVVAEDFPEDGEAFVTLGTSVGSLFCLGYVVDGPGEMDHLFGEDLRVSIDLENGKECQYQDLEGDLHTSILNISTKDR